MLNKKQILDIKKSISGNSLEERFPLVFNALSDRGRFRIFRLLLDHCGVCVTDIAKILGVSVPAASQQLRVLEITGLVRKERRGQTIRYEIKSEDPLIKKIIKIITTKNVMPRLKVESPMPLEREKTLVG